VADLGIVMILDRLLQLHTPEELRRALLIGSLLALVSTLAAASASGHGDPGWTLLAVAATALLGLDCWRLWRTGRCAWWLDAGRGLALGALSAALGADNALPVVFLVLGLRVQYGTRGHAFANATLCAAVHVAAAELGDRRYADYDIGAALANVPLLFAVCAGCLELARGLRVIDAGRRRERALAETLESFLTLPGLDALRARTLKTLETVLGARLAAAELVLDGTRLAEARHRFGGAADEFSVGADGVLLVLTWDALDAADRGWLDLLADQLALAVTVARSRLSAAAERLSDLVESAGGAALVLESDLTVRWATPGVSELYGTPAHALAGTPVLDLVHPEFRAVAQTALATVGEAGPAPAAESRLTVRLTDREGPRWVEVALMDLRADEAVGGLVVQARDVSARVALESEARTHASRDGLTGLPNRSAFERLVSEAVRRSGDRPAVVLIDLDGFHTVNDRLGHAEGDRLLAEAARRLVAAVGAAGVVARLAGDVFAVLLDDYRDPAGARRDVDRLLEAAARPFEHATGLVRLTASAGVARVADGPRTPEALVTAARVALQDARRRGRGRWTLFEPALLRRELERVALLSELESAVAAGQLELDYQPIVDARTGTWRYAEALMRWRHPQLGRLGPDRFIPLAEESGLIVTLGSWALREATRQLARWRRSGAVPERFGVTVNVAAKQLTHGDLPAEVAAALAEHDLPPSCLTLELTETALIDLDGAAEPLRRIRDLGVRIAIDDFGTGYSSLAYLKDIPADVVKLPRPFIRDAEDGPGGAVVKGLVDLARPLGMTVVAEGVETRGQRDVAVAAGCDVIQGYLFAAPMAPAELAAMVAVAAHPARHFGGGREAFAPGLS
jgi:diguanylate cyclase (GGDEF)-like protein/PAS domain S-box-containing protein